MLKTLCGAVVLNCQDPSLPFHVILAFASIDWFQDNSCKSLDNRCALAKRVCERLVTRNIPPSASHAQITYTCRIMSVCEPVCHSLALADRVFTPTQASGLWGTFLFLESGRQAFVKTQVEVVVIVVVVVVATSGWFGFCHLDCTCVLWPRGGCRLAGWEVLCWAHSRDATCGESQLMLKSRSKFELEWELQVKGAGEVAGEVDGR